MDQQSSLFVDQYYMMDPEFEDLLADGTELRNGMVVLCENPLWRKDMASAIERGGFAMRQALENNRWCQVTNLRVENRYDTDRETGEVTRIYQVITFVGVYGDGVKIKRSFSPNASWIVKLDSILP